MKRIIPAFLISALILCACGNNAGQADVSITASQNNPGSEVSENETKAEVSENVIEEVEEVREPLTITYTVSEDEVFEEFTFSRIPVDVKDLEEIDASLYDDPYAVAAIAIISMCNFEANADETIKMLEYLNGTEGLTDYEKDFHRAELEDREYKPFSYINGATPENYYTPDTPYVIRIYGDKFTWVLEGRVKIFAHTSGSEKPRAINVRYDDQVKRWCVYEHGLLGYMRAPGPEVIEEEEETATPNTETESTSSNNSTAENSNEDNSATDDSNAGNSTMNNPAIENTSTNNSSTDNSASDNAVSNN